MRIRRRKFGVIVTAIVTMMALWSLESQAGALYSASSQSSMTFSITSGSGSFDWTGVNNLFDETATLDGIAISDGALNGFPLTSTPVVVNPAIPGITYDLFASADGNTTVFGTAFGDVETTGILLITAITDMEINVIVEWTIKAQASVLADPFSIATAFADIQVTSRNLDTGTFISHEDMAIDLLNGDIDTSFQLYGTTNFTLNLQEGVRMEVLVISDADGTASSVQPVPEPTSFLLLGIGLVGLAGVEVRRRRKKSAVDNS